MKKSSEQRGAAFAKGGTTQMLGKGDRTRTAPSDAANVQAAGVTGHKTPGRNMKQPTGGPKLPRNVTVAAPAKPGRSGAVRGR